MANHSRITINSRSIVDGKLKEDFDTENYGNNVKEWSREELVNARDREQNKANSSSPADSEVDNPKKKFGTQEYHQDNVDLWQNRIDYLDNN